MKVLAIAKTLRKGGAASGARNTIAALRSAGAEVVAVDAASAQSRRPIGVVRAIERTYERVVHSADTHCLKLAPATLDLVRLCQEHSPDIVQLFDVSGNTIAFKALTDLPVPVVQRLSDFWPYHGARHYKTQTPQTASIADHLLKYTIYCGERPDVFVAPSHWLSNRLDGSRVTVIRNAVSAQPDVAPREGITDRLRFGFIANPVHDPRKGFSALPKSLAELATRFGSVELHVFGRHSAQTFSPVPGVVTKFHGPFQPQGLPNVFAQFDILLCPSLMDNSPNVVSESLAFGVPVIGQSNTGMASYVTESTGALMDFHNGAPGEIGREVARILSSYAEMSSAAQRYVERELSPRVIGQKYLKLYGELVASGVAT